ncbi:MAG: GtrA family protein [Parcubacteria group bacterium]|nr:GtrA family protein [Parcubacteria group bacterium]
MLASLRSESGQIGRFLVVGGICVSTYYGFFIGLTELGVWYIVSAAIAFSVYYVVHFSLQKFWAFKNKNKEYIKQQLLQYSVMAVLNWIINTGLLYILVEYWGMWYVTAQIMLTIIVSIIAYVGFRCIFRHR